MRKILALVFIFSLVFVGPALAQKIIAETVFPWKLGETEVPLYPEDIEELCMAEIIGAECSVNVDGGTPVEKDVPYSGSAEYSGSVNYSGPTTVIANGTVEYPTYNKTAGGSFTYAVLGAGMCGEVGDDGKVNCCEIKGDPGGLTVHMVCYKVPAENIIINNTFLYDICQPITADVPWSYEGPGEAVAVNIPYSGSVNYSGVAKTEVMEYKPTDVIHVEGNAQITCPDVGDVPTQTVQFRELVTKAVVGETINVEATGFSFVAKTLRQRMIVSYKALPNNAYTVVMRTEKDIFASTAGGQFTDAIENYTFENAGIYRFQFKVWKQLADGSFVLASKAINRTVVVTEAP